MTQSAEKTVSRIAVADFESGYQSARSAGNAVFTGLFQLYCYTYLCIKNLVLIDFGCSSGGMFVQSVDFIKQHNKTFKCPEFDALKKCG